ncbi:tyrosine-type recombinase/integrase [Nonomuraea sp. NPDC049480]|uniref:tyrosine-type recombinase/integrase n=1 Tax=Nonomuraea sp. NPDC049480 TaxID=3364353 RepID=UPI00379AE935
MTGNGFKRCKCRDEASRELGAKCPKLRRKDGSWNPKHGTWYGKEEVPAGPDGKRIYLRCGGFTTETDLVAFYQQAGRLLEIPEAGPDGHDARMEILEMIRAAHKKQAPLPNHDELRRKYDSGQPLGSMLFGDFFTETMAAHERTGDIRKTTLRSYRSHYEQHLKEVLAGVRMDRLWVSTLQKVFTRIDEKNEGILAAQASDDPEVRAAARGKRLTGPATKQRIRATLSTVLSDAVRQEIISVNNAKAVKLDAVKRPKALVWSKARVEAFNAKFAARLEAVRAEKGGKKVSAVRVWEASELRPSPVMVWTPVQLGAFLDVAAQHRLYALFHLIAFRGLRRGEGCGARWEFLDLDERTLAVAKQLVQVGWDFEEGDPKTEASDGVIALDTGTVAVLREHRKQQLEEKLAWGEAWTDTGRIFTHEDGTELHPAWVSELFSQLAFKAGLPPIRLHDLRHCAATLAYAAGADTKMVSTMLRHSSTNLTENTYTTVLPELAHSAAEASAALVPRALKVAGSETPGLPTVSHGDSGDTADSSGVVKPLVRRA